MNDEIFLMGTTPTNALTLGAPYHRLLMEFLKDCVYSGNKYRLEEFFNWGVAPKSLYTPLKYLLIRWYLRKTPFEYWKGSPTARLSH